MDGRFVLGKCYQLKQRYEKTYFYERLNHIKFIILYNVNAEIISSNVQEQTFLAIDYTDLILLFMSASCVCAFACVCVFPTTIIYDISLFNATAYRNATIITTE